MPSLVHLIDAPVYIFRAWVTLPAMPAPDGTPTGGAYGYANTLLRFLRERAPTHVAACFDHAVTSFRNELFPGYKASRGDERLFSVETLTIKPKTHEFLILAPEIVAGQTSPRIASIRLDPVQTQEAFGSPQQIGQSLLSTFLLPFELVSLLLLVAMVGAIILSKREL